MTKYAQICQIQAFRAGFCANINIWESFFGNIGIHGFTLAVLRVITYMQPNEALCVTIRELQDMLKCSRRQIYRLIKLKKITPLKTLQRRNYVFDKEQILKLIKNK